MVILVGTLGFHPEKFLAAVPAVGTSVERVVVYTGAQTRPRERERSARAVEEVLRTLDALALPHEHREFSSPWAYADIFRTLVGDLERLGPRDTLFNLTGGPKTMTVAATMACLMLGVRVVYVPEELEGPGRPVELPLLRIRYSQVLTPAQHRILRAVRDHQPATLDALARRLRRQNATVSYHVENLVRAGALRLEADPNRRTVRRPVLTDAGEIMLLAQETLTRRE